MREWILAMVAVSACRGDAPDAGSAAAPAPAPAWTGACLDALERASSAPPGDRIPLALAGCRPCGVDWRDAAAAVPSTVVAVIDACELGCARTARSAFYAAISALDDDQRATGPWRALGKSCPAVLGDRGGDGRYANATWFALHQIARRLGTAPLTAREQERWRALQGALWLPLPVVSQVGTQFVLPTATAVVDAPVTHVTITSEAVTIGALPRARLDDRGVAVAPDASAPWPGDAIGDGGLAAALDARGAKEVVLIAPTGLAARRVLAIAAALGGRRGLLAVTRGEGGLAATAVGFTPGPIAGALVIDASASRACATSATGAVAACTELPAEPAARRALLGELTAGHPRIAIAVLTAPSVAPAGRRAPPAPVVDAAAIAARLDELAGLTPDVGAAELPGPWPSGTPAAVRAALAGAR